MLYKYQLIFLGNIIDPITNNIRDAFLGKIKELGLSLDCIEIILPDEFNQKYSNKNPTFCYYIGNCDDNNRDLEILQKILTNGDAILPLYFKKDNFNNEIPEILHPINGALAVGKDISFFADAALEGLRLLRKTRKIFISYKRTDSSGVAVQLFDELLKNNFDPFLDSYSIPPTADFQEELYHRMSDSDVLVQLLTTNFHESKYCREEIETSNLKQIGVVQVVWPDCQTDKTDHLCVSFKLENEDLIKVTNTANCTLSDDCLKKLIGLIESCRARNLAARQDTLCGEFIQEAKKADRLVLQEKHYLIERDNDKLVAIYLPAVGVPTSYDCYASIEFRNLLETPDLKVYLLYDSLKVQKHWVDHLNWLNSSLEVKTIKRCEFDKFMVKK